MKDGHINICKECIKSRNKYNRNSQKDNLYEKNKRDNKKKLCRRRTLSAIKKKLLIKPNICSKCHNIGNIQAHHINYDNFMDVVWLCPECHGLEHRKVRYNNGL